MNTDFMNKIDEIVAKDSRYKVDAYEFMLQALWFTQNKLKIKGHISGKQLTLGVKQFVLQQYGPMAKTLLGHWGVYETIDLGRIVFNMIDAGLMRKSDNDTIDDFKDVYNFNDAFQVFKTLKHKQVKLLKK